MTETSLPTTDNHDRPFRRRAKATLKAVGLVLGLAALVHVGWNLFAPDLFALEPIRMKQALGLVLFAGAFAFLFRCGARHRPSSNASS
jgi:hypothetical protein